MHFLLKYTFFNCLFHPYQTDQYDLEKIWTLTQDSHLVDCEILVNCKLAERKTTKPRGLRETPEAKASPCL